VSRLDEGFKSENISEILKETKQVSEDELYEQDVRDIVYVLEKTKEKTETQDDRQNFIDSSSNIVSQNKRDVWVNIPSRNDLAKEIISGTDLNARNYISQTAETGEIVTYSTPNIDVRGIRLPTVKPTEPELEDIRLLDAVGEGVIIPAVVTNKLKQATVVKYSSIKDILSEEELKDSVDNTIGSTESLTIRSTIVSFTSEPQFNVSASNPFKIVLQNNQTGYVCPRRTCAFIEPEINNSMWGSEGCTLNEAESNEDNVTCDCDHTTAFAIIMDVAGVQLTESEREILETISTVGCSISLVGIVLTILMHVLFWKHVKSPRAKILVNLCVAIGFTDIFAILEGVARDSPNFCKAVAALLHFFVLSAFGWMLCEGILLYILLIRVFDGVRGKHWKIFYFIGWGIPLLIVAVSFGATQGEGYGTESSCWLSVENKLIWAFVGPAFLVILANTIVFVMVLRTMMKSQKVKLQDNFHKVRTGVKASVIIFPILGLTWIFGVMTFNRETLFFRYLFAVFNSAQGLLIFLFHCVLNKQIRDIVRNSTWRRSTLSTGSGKNYFRHPKSSSSSPKKTVIGSRINEKMVEKSARLQLESNGWKSESAGHGGNNNLNVSVAEEARENENMMSPLQGHSSSNEFVGRDNDAVEGEAYHRTRNGELGNSSSTDRPSNNEEAHLAV
ncbi:adhesion G- coupled receptor D1-like, partial [Paramuricea clavata]